MLNSTLRARFPYQGAPAALLSRRPVGSLLIHVLTASIVI
jgi:hypothetical protein